MSASSGPVGRSGEAGQSLLDWASALRTAWRQLLRHKARNLAVVLLLALPILAASTVDTVAHTTTLSTAEAVTRQMGGADALIEPLSPGQPVYQTADMSDAIAAAAYDSTVPTPDTQQVESMIEAVLPKARAVPWQPGSATVDVESGPGILGVNAVLLDFDQPVASGLYDLLQGRFPRTGSEIALSPAAERELGTAVGRTVAVPGQRTRFTVVGTLQDPDATDADQLYALPSSPLATAAFARVGGVMTADSASAQPDWLVSNPGGVTWEQVQQLNEEGLVVASRQVIENPPAQTQQPYYAVQPASPQPPYSPLVPAAASRSASAQKAAAAADVDRIVIGLALIEVLLLVGPAYAISARRRRREYAQLDAVDADPGHLHRVVLADGLILGALAAVLGVSGGLGVAALAVQFGVRYSHRSPGAFRAAPIDLICIAALVAVLGIAAGAAGFLYRSRTVPAVAAVMVAVAGAIVVGSWAASYDAEGRAYYQPLMRNAQGGVQLAWPGAATGLVSQLRAQLPGSTVTPIDGTSFGCGNLNAPGTDCVDLVLYEPGSGSTTDTGFLYQPIGDSALLKTLTGISDPAATAMLDRGGVLVFAPGVVQNGMVTFRVDAPGQADTAGAQAEYYSLPALYLDNAGGPKPIYFLSSEAAWAMRVPIEPAYLLFQQPDALTSAQQAKINDLVTNYYNKLAPSGGRFQTPMYVEAGYQSQDQAAGKAALVVAMLAAMLAVLTAAVGTARRTRRAQAASQALVTTSLGSLSGAILGLLVAWALLRGSGANGAVLFMVPRLDLVVVLLVLPAATALLAAVTAGHPRAVSPPAASED